MTSDAKIGLLLGLVFIFVIAFLINGLPGLHGKDDTNKLTTNMVGLQSSPPGIGANERKVQMTLEQPAAPAEDSATSAESDAGSTDLRFTMALPQNTPTTTDSAPAAVTEPAAASPSAENIVIAPVQPQPVVKVDTKKQDVPKFYVVEEGDTLSSVAKKVYGEEEGNRLVNINAIFEANRVTLVSADDLQVGQKLVIPPLAVTAAPVSTPGGVISEKVFSKVDSIGKRHLPAGPVKPAASASPVKKSVTTKLPSQTKTDRIYIVKEGDSLWRIAADQLGDGNRYKEIVKLNSDVLSSEDDIQVDMKLKLPTR